jgi:hypothetical protein
MSKSSATTRTGSGVDMVAAAVIGGAVIGAAGSAVAGHQASQASKGATNASIAEQDKALQQQSTLSAPYRGLGEAGIPKLEQLLGIAPPAGATQAGPAYMPGPNGQMTPIMQNGGSPGAAGPSMQETLAGMPGYQFAKQQGLEATTNAATAMGLGRSGNTLQAIDKFSTGLADSTYQQEVGNLENVVNTGQAAAAGQAANVGNAAANNSSALINQGNNQAGIDANTIAGITKSIGNAGNQYIANQTLQGLQNPDIMQGAPYADPSGSGYTYNMPGGP